MPETEAILNKVSNNIKRLRKEKGKTLKALAEKAGLSAGYLSRVENAQKVPNFSTIVKIGLALEVSISDLFLDSGNQEGISIVRKNERRNMAWPGTNQGYDYSALTHGFHNPKMRAAIVSFPISEKEPLWFEHRGEQLAVVLEGKIKFIFKEREYILDEGDAVYFDCTIPHTSMGLGEKKPKVLTVIYRNE